jgi:hypothetical protein
MKREEILLLQQLERCFWGLWALAPFLLGLAIYYTWHYPYAFGQDIEVSKNFVSSFSLGGQLLVGMELLIHTALYVILMGLMHALVRRFTRGQMLISITLSTMKNIAWLLLVSVFIGVLLYNLNLYLLFRWGDLPSWQPLYFIDVMSLALALILLALRILIRHAMRMQEDVDLTV